MLATLSAAETTRGILDRDLAYQAALEDHRTLLTTPATPADPCADRRPCLLGAAWTRAAGGQASRHTTREAALRAAGECATMTARYEAREDLQRRIRQTAARVLAPEGFRRISGNVADNVLP